MIVEFAWRIINFVMVHVGKGIRILLQVALLLVACSLIGSRLSGMVKPDATAARMFGLLLQNEFSTKKSAAFLERIDGKAFYERFFRSKDIQDAYPWANKPDIQPSALTEPIKGLNVYTFLAQFRVTLDNDIRTLDCEFVNEKGGFKSVRFFLAQDEHGDIRIVDFQWGGDAMLKSQISRHSWLLQGKVPPQPHNAEEEQLASYSKKYGRTFTRVVEEYGRGQVDASFAAMRNLPPEVRGTRICHHYLTCQYEVDPVGWTRRTGD